MKVLLDACIWGGTRAILERAGHDVIWAGDWAEDPGDSAILAHAHGEQRVLVTMDKDFGELAIVRRIPHCEIVRLVGWPVRRGAEVLVQALLQYGGDLAQGAILTVEPGRVRVRPPEL